MNLRFLNFEVLWFLSVLPMFGFLIFAFAKYHRGKALKHIDKKLIPSLIDNVSYTKRNIKLALRLICLIFMIFVLARPQVGNKKIKISQEGIELIILFDVSRSMMADDVKPTRLDFAKKEISRLLSSLQGHRVGLLAFAGSGLLLSPMTVDSSALVMFVDSLSPDTVSTQGTEYARALSTAMSAFQRGGVGKFRDTTAARAIIIVSDGEDHNKGSLETAKKLAQKGVKIFTLGVGTEKGGPIPLRDREGRFYAYFKDKNGKVVYTKTKTDLLKKIAKVGEGSFYQMSHGSRSIQRLLSDLDQLEKAEFENLELTSYDEQFQLFLLLALLFAFIDFLLSDQKNTEKKWRGRFETTT